jgi:hypothetical protein
MDKGCGMGGEEAIYDGKGKKVGKLYLLSGGQWKDAARQSGKATIEKEESQRRKPANKAGMTKTQTDKTRLRILGL